MNNADANTRRYLEITRAHHTLASLAHPASLLHEYVNEVAVWEADDDSTPLYDALADLRDTTGLAAVGIAAPYEPDTWGRVYADKLTERLALVAEHAETIAAGARAVLNAFNAGLLTAPRPWSVDDITGGTMHDYLYEATGDGDAAHVWGCIDALAHHRLADDITAAVYDHHMRAIDELWTNKAYARTPEHEAALVDDALSTWREHEDAANNALTVPVPFLRAAQAINAADTFARLGHYAAALTGPAWSKPGAIPDMYDDVSAAADRLMIRLAQRYYTMGVDAAGVARSDAAELGNRITAWRERLFDDAVIYANTLDVAALDNDVERGDALTDAYGRLYRAADAAITTSELLDVWNGADVLDDEYRDRVRISIAVRFDSDTAPFGLPLVDDGAHREATRTLRRLVDELDMPQNAPTVAAYRGHLAALDELDVRDNLAGDLNLVRIWSDVVADADAGTITRRQVAELRDRTNAKVAEYCDGHEAKAAQLASRLPEWQRITEELYGSAE